MQASRPRPLGAATACGVPPGTLLSLTASPPDSRRRPNSISIERAWHSYACPSRKPRLLDCARVLAPILGWVQAGWPGPGSER